MIASADYIHTENFQNRRKLNHKIGETITTHCSNQSPFTASTNKDRTASIVPIRIEPLIVQIHQINKFQNTKKKKKNKSNKFEEGATENLIGVLLGDVCTDLPITNYERIYLSE